VSLHVPRIEHITVIYSSRILSKRPFKAFHNTLIVSTWAFCQKYKTNSAKILKLSARNVWTVIIMRYFWNDFSTNYRLNTTSNIVKPYWIIWCAFQFIQPENGIRLTANFSVNLTTFFHTYISLRCALSRYGKFLHILPHSPPIKASSESIFFCITWLKLLLPTPCLSLKI